MLAGTRTSARRWVILAVGTLTQAASSAFVYGIAVLLPEVRRAEALSLVGASLVVTAPAVGLLLTLFLAGAAADRYGERVVIATGVGLSAVFLAATSLVHGALPLSILLVLAGAGAGSVNAASGRMIMGWFTAAERGFAMGIRQTAQPVGFAIAAISLPPLGDRFGLPAALLFLAGLSAVSAVAVLVLVIDPPRPTAVTGATPAGSPYRGDRILVRIHAASALLVIPQFAVSTYTLVYLVGARHWDAISAGRLIFGFQFAGAFGRVASGVWSDRVGSRLRPMRQLAAAAALLMAGLATGAWTHQWWIVVIFGFASVVTVADNGLAYVAVAERAGSAWAGRALGVQNSGQNIVGIAIIPLLAVIIQNTNYGFAFLVATIAALAAIPITPVRQQGKASEQWHKVPASDSTPSDG